MVWIFFLWYSIVGYHVSTVENYRWRNQVASCPLNHLDDQYLADIFNLTVLISDNGNDA